MYKRQVELAKDSNLSLLQDFIKKNFVDMGMCADFSIHNTDGHNPHAHILLTVRPLNENGTVMNNFASVGQTGQMP